VNREGIVPDEWRPGHAVSPVTIKDAVPDSAIDSANTASLQPFPPSMWAAKAGLCTRRCTRIRGNLVSPAVEAHLRELRAQAEKERLVRQRCRIGRTLIAAGEALVDPALDLARQPSSAPSRHGRTFTQ